MTRTAWSTSTAFSPRARSAFTLIELLLVLVILAVLAAVAVPVYTNQLEKSRVKATITEINVLKGALATFQLDNGRFPATEEGLNALVSRPADLGDSWNGPYIEQVTTDKWGIAYQYSDPDPEHPTNYKLFSCGGDKVPFTIDDITQYTIAEGTAAP